MIDSLRQEVSNDLKNYSTQFDEFRQSVQFLSDSVDKSNELTAKIREEYIEIKKENEVLFEENKRLKHSVTELKDRVRSLEQYTRKNNIEISGIPQTPKEDSLSVLKDVAAALGLDVPDGQVSAVHRVPTYKQGRTPSIIVQFQARMQRDVWIAAFKKKRSLSASEVNPAFPKQQLVYVSEHLSPENKQFLGELKQKCREKGVKFAWAKEGKFFVRRREGEKCHKVKNIEDLNSLYK